MKNRILLIAIGVSMVDIRTAMALQKLNEDDYIIVNDDASLEQHMKQMQPKEPSIPDLKAIERHMVIDTPTLFHTTRGSREMPFYRNKLTGRQPFRTPVRNMQAARR